METKSPVQEVTEFSPLLDGKAYPTFDSEMLLSPIQSENR